MSDKSTKQEEYDGSTMLRSVMQEAVISRILSETYPTDAYFEVYKTKSKKVAEAAVCRMLSKVRPKARLKYKREQLAKKYEVDEERITRERAKIGFANIQDFIGETGQIKPITEISRDKMAAVAEIKLDPTLGTVIEFKFHNKQTALDGLSKQIGAYEKDNEQKRESIFDILAIVGLNVELGPSAASVGLNSGDTELNPVDMKVIEGKTDV